MGKTIFQAHVVLPGLNALVGSSVLAIVAVTFERWLSICHPIQAKNIQSPLRAKLIITAAWIISFALFLPYCFRKHVTVCWDPTSSTFLHKTEEHIAYTHSTGFTVYVWIRESVLRLLPMVLLAVLNIRIVFALRQLQSRRRKLKGGGSAVSQSGVSVSKQQRRKKSTERSLSRGSSLRQSMHSSPAQKAERRRLQEERRLVLLLIGIVVMFLVCVTPSAILLILPIPDSEFTFGLKLFRAVANLLELTNYALNFYVYVGCSSDFRLTFVSVFCQRCQRKKAHTQENGNRSFSPLATMGTRIQENSRMMEAASVMPSPPLPVTDKVGPGSREASISNTSTPISRKRGSHLALPSGGGGGVRGGGGAVTDQQATTESHSLLEATKYV